MNAPCAYVCTFVCVCEYGYKHAIPCVQWATWSFSFTYFFQHHFPPWLRPESLCCFIMHMRVGMEASGDSLVSTFHLLGVLALQIHVTISGFIEGWESNSSVHVCGTSSLSFEPSAKCKEMLSNNIPAWSGLP